MNRKLTLFKKLIFSTPIVLLPLTSQAQFLQTIDAAANSPYTPQSLITNVFLGNGVEVTNVTYNGNPAAVGYFSGGTQAVGLDRGIVMTTGYAGTPPAGSYGPTSNAGAFAHNMNLSTAFDANLDAIATAPLRDVAVYTITFVPTSDTVRFRYCFASEEYPEYSCTLYNDIFGFFIQGLGYPIPTNIALIPGTNLPVAINNIHPFNTQNNPIPNPCQPEYIQYYNVINTGSQPVYDGRTDVFTAMAVVVPCEEYKITLAIADVQDPGWDSGVFLEAKSFGTSGLHADVKGVGLDGSFAEGCTPATITFSMANPLPNDYPVDVHIFGTATPGVDFQNLPANIVIPAGQTQATFQIPAFEDNISEPLEMIAFDLLVDACRRDTVYLFLRDNQLVAPMLHDTTVCVQGAQITLNGTVPVAVDQPLVFSNTQDANITPGGSSITSVINVSGVQSTNLGPGVIRSVCINMAHPDDGDVDIFLISPGGQALELTTDNGGNGNDYIGTCFTPSAVQAINFPGPQAPATAAPFTGNFKPEGPWNDLWDKPNRPTNGAWSLKVSDDLFPYTGVLQDWSLTFSPMYEVTYQWSPAIDLPCPTCASNTFAPTTSGTYTVTATDNYGCTATADAYIGVANAFATAVVDNPITCAGQQNGSISVNVGTGGTNTYQWSQAGQTGTQISNLSGGTYTVTVTNSGGCSATSSVTLTEPLPLNIGANTQNITCFGQSNGMVGAQVSGGTSPYQYAWNNGQMTANLSGLLAGSYTVTVNDANGCTATQSYTITQPSALVLSTTNVQPITCANSQNGAISIGASGGTGALTYSWNTGQSGAQIGNLGAGTYTVTVSDSQGCSSTFQQTLTAPPALVAFPTPVAVHCFGENNGEIHLDVHGGNPGYTVAWQGPAGFTGSGINLSGLTAGNYAATVTDQTGCTQTLNSTVTQPADIQLNLPLVSDTVCYQGSNGTATAQVSGGTGSFTYVWDAAGQTNATATGLSAQEYHVTVTDANGCTESGKTFIFQKDQLNAFAEATLPKCHDGADATASVLSVYYGITPANTATFNYSWNTTPPQNQIIATNLVANQTYRVLITDADGCTASYTVMIGNPESLFGAVSDSGPAKCNGEASGWATATASGGVGPYSWNWGGGLTPTSATGTGLLPGTNTVTITDANGCSDVASVIIDEPDPIALQVTPSAVKCYGETTGSASAHASGGNSSYQFAWSNGQQGDQLKDVAAGFYDLTVTDANGCRNATTTEIKQPAEPITGTSEMKEPRCHGDHNGQIMIEAAGGTPPYRYSLNNGPYNGSSMQLGLAAGIYQPRIMDGNGCTVDLSPIEVTQQEALQVELGPNIEILLGQDTQLVATVTNNSGDFMILWSPEDSTWLSCLDCINPSVYSLQYSNYFEVRVIDSMGCRATDQILVTVDKPRKVFVPTAFSPNGDLTNDLLLVHGQKTSKALVFRIYDRWGEMVYEAKDFGFNDEHTGWDGTFRGQPMDPGVFVWVLQVEYVDGATEWYKGNTTLIR